MVKMHRLLLRILLSAVALLVVAYLVSGVKVSFPAALGGAVVLGVLNGVLGPILRLVSLPLTVMTLGLFSLVINAALFALGAWLVPGFEIQSVGAAFLGSILFGILCAIINFALRDRAESKQQAPARMQ
jgi:putative membrane protein